MRLGTLGVRNIGRNKLRTTLTVVAVAIANILFVTLCTVTDAWTAAVDHSAKDRIGTRHKVTFIMTMPLKYVEEIREVPGVVQASWANWFGGKHPLHETEFFQTLATDPETLLEVMPEIEVPEAQKQAWFANKQGALIGDVIAKKFDWKVGDRITLRGTIFPGDWEFTVEGIYEAKRRTVDRSTLWFHWEYFNDRVEGRLKDQVGWIMSRIDDPSKSAQIQKAIDKKFEDRDIQTLTMSERAMQTSFMGMFMAVFTAIDIGSLVILVIMLLILANTIAMGVRERTNEYGVLRAIGFRQEHLAGFIVGESATIGLLGGAIGLGLAYPLVELGLGRFLEENMGSFFPYFRIAGSTAMWAIVMSLVLGAIAAAIPAYRAAKLDVVDSLRRIG